MDTFWPIPVLGSEIKPRISDGFGEEKRAGKGHYGADIMYPRAQGGEFEYPQFTPHYMMPNGTPCLAMSAGTVLRFGESGTGRYVEIDHGARWGLGRATTVYRHLAETLVSKGDVVAAGQQIGVCGNDPRSGAKSINHLHFELWDRKKPDGPRLDIAFGVDPGPVLAKCAYKYMDGRLLVADGGDIGVIGTGGWSDSALQIIELAKIGLIAV